MDLTTYIREGHFRLEIETLLDNPSKWPLIYYASGRVDKNENLIREFRHRTLVEFFPTLQSYSPPSASKSHDAGYGDATPWTSTTPLPHTHTLPSPSLSVESLHGSRSSKYHP